MQKLISIPYRTMLRRLLNSEHFYFYELFIIKAMHTLINSMPQLSGIFNALQSVFERENALFKLSQASIQTHHIALLNEKRVACFSYLWASVAIFRFERTDSDIQNAVQTLEFLHNTYKNMTIVNYYEMSGMMINFLHDCEKPNNKQSIELLGLTGIVDKIKTTEEVFDQLYDERSSHREQIADLGKLTEIRTLVDDTFATFIEGINSNWAVNEMGTKDPSLRLQLIEAKDHIIGAIHQAKLTLSHRKHHKTKDKDTTEDKATQTPDTTNLTTPPTPKPDPAQGKH